MSTMGLSMSTASTLTFTQGLIVGQASFLILCLLFIRYVVFSPSEELDGDSWKRKRDERLKVSNSLQSYPPSTFLHTVSRLTLPRRKSYRQTQCLHPPPHIFCSRRDMRWQHIPPSLPAG